MRSAEQHLEVLGRSPSAWGRNEKMPPPSLSTTTNVASIPRSRDAEQAVGVVQEAEVAEQRDDRTCPRSGHRRGGDAEHRRDEAVDPVDAAVRDALAARRAAPRTHSTSRTGMLDATTSVAPSGKRGRDVAGDPALERLRPRVEQRVDRGARARSPPTRHDADPSGFGRAAGHRARRDRRRGARPRRPRSARSPRARGRASRRRDRRAPARRRASATASRPCS